MDLTRKMTKTQNQMNNDVKVPDGAELIDEVFLCVEVKNEALLKYD